MDLYPEFPHPQVTSNQRLRRQHSNSSLSTVDGDEEVITTTSERGAMGKHTGEVEDHASNPAAHEDKGYEFLLPLSTPAASHSVFDHAPNPAAHEHRSYYQTPMPAIEPSVFVNLNAIRHKSDGSRDPTHRRVHDRREPIPVAHWHQSYQTPLSELDHDPSPTDSEMRVSVGPPSRISQEEKPSLSLRITAPKSNDLSTQVTRPVTGATSRGRGREQRETGSLHKDSAAKLQSTLSVASGPSSHKQSFSFAMPTLSSIKKTVERAPANSPQKMPAAGHSVSDTDLITSIPDPLSEPWDKVKDSPKVVSVDHRIDVLGDHIATAENKTAPFIQPTTVAANAIGQTDIGKAIKEGIDHFFDGMPTLMKALDELVKLHPFVGVVVLAFKTVYNLEQKRRDNEKKIIALYVQMKHMMGVLLHLRDVRTDNLKILAPDGTSIEDRLTSLAERTALDIRSCCNVCDTYTKKRLLAKVFQGSAWDVKLLSWVTLFSKRRKEFEFELSIRTSRGVDEAHAKLNALDEKMSVLTAMFEQLISPEQKRVAATVLKKGGVATIRNDDDMLLEVEKASSKASPSAEGHQVLSSWAKPSDAKVDADDLKADIFEDPDVAVEKNEAVYFRKFEVQKLQIIDELNQLKSVVKRESDRVIEEMKSGPHQRICDRTIYKIWDEMGWRGSVKARYFVLALRDYYVEKLAAEAEGVPMTSPTLLNTPRDPDVWAIKSIDVTSLRPISEAFDDDASGFITISEMNQFTGSRPPDWSLPHWIAFWAVGYKAYIINYANKIEELFTKMEETRIEVLPPNQKFFDNYFTFVWKVVHTLTAAVTSLEPELGTSSLERFKSYIEAEETRLSASLKAVDYNIDGTDTLTLVTGVGRIEKTVLPLIYLLTKHHYEIIRAMRTKVLDWRELGSGVESFINVKDAIQYRVNDLTSIFLHQKLKPEKEFQNFAYGMFKYFHNLKDLWSSDYVRTLDPPVTPSTDVNEDQNFGQGEVLKYEPKDDLLLDDWVYDGHSIDDAPNYRDVEPPLKDILGHWHGYFYEVDGARESTGIDSMMTLVLEPTDGRQAFKANAWSIRGQFTITGSWYKGEDDVTKIKFKMTFQKFQSVSWFAFFNGQFDAERNALAGFWGLSAGPGNLCGQMVFRRIPPRYLTMYPSLKELSDDSSRSRALWRFAIAAVRNDVRRERWSWSYFSQRRKDRVAVISLGIRYWHFGTPVNHEDQSCTAAAQRLTAADACFYFSKINRTAAYVQLHVNAWCNRCYGRIGGARLFCLDCDHKNTETFRTLDLCCAQECMNARITHRQDLKVAHEPSHRLVKVRTVVLERRLGRVHTAALVAFGRVKTLCAKIAESNQRFVEDDKKGEVAGPDTRNQSNPEPTPEDTRTESDDGLPPDHTPDVPNDTTVDGGASKGPRGENLQDGKRPRDSDSPSCGKCRGRLSFPCWYCIYCKDDLFLCEACDREGDFELMRGSGKHTEDHHLIHCLAPEKDDSALSSTERRLISLEDQLSHMQSRMQSQFDNMQSRLESRWESRFGGLIQDLTTRIGNMEQLLNKLAGAETVA